MPSRDQTRKHLLILTLAFGVLYTVGLDNHGITNWQEGVRLLAARDMAEHGDWIVPTIHGEPYLAKPPLIYWAQLTTARLRGAPIPKLFDLRLVVAIAGVLGVLATYLAARVLLRLPRPNIEPTTEINTADPNLGTPFESRAALWAAWLAGTGILFTRSARIGELDILLIPTVTGAIAAGAYATLSTGPASRRALAWIASIALASLAALTKGPAGLLVFACALPGGLTLSLIFGSAPLRTRIRQALLGWGVCLTAIGGALACLYWWSAAVASRIGQEAVDAAVRTESGENLRWLEFDAWIKYAEALSYGAGLASMLCFAAFWRLLRSRPPSRLPITPGLWIVLGHLGLSVVAFALSTKGVPRYLTPVWPSLGLLAGWWLVQRIDYCRENSKQHPAEFCAIVIAILAIGQAAWYGYGREWKYPHRSPRALAAELLTEHPARIDPARLGALDLWSPALDLEFGIDVRPWSGPADTSDVPYARPTRIESLAEFLIEDLKANPDSPPYTMLVRSVPDRERESFGLPIDQLRASGVKIIVLETRAQWHKDNGRTPVIPVHVMPKGH